jgi:lipoprotein-anchoring transpeptidase ErfK/SrfK
MLSRLAIATLCSLLSVPISAQNPPAPPPRFHAVRVEGMTTVRELQKTHGREGFEAILHLNRIDLEHLRQGAILVVPEGPVTMAAISPFPLSIPELTAAPRILLVSRRVQAFAAYERGQLARWGAISSGRAETPTPVGLFATNWRSRLRRSTDNPAWLLPWYFNFINSSGVSFHQFDLPGYPASHACVRLLETDAMWIYNWAESWVLADQGRRVEVYGTPVLVFGDYDFGSPGPWTRLVENPVATAVALEEILLALEPHRHTLAERIALRQAWAGSDQRSTAHGPRSTVTKVLARRTLGRQNPCSP